MQNIVWIVCLVFSKSQCYGGGVDVMGGGGEMIQDFKRLKKHTQIQV